LATIAGEDDMDDKSRGEPANSETRGSHRTGPRTPLGKAGSKFNAIKAGIFAKMVLTAEPFREHKKDFTALLEDLRGAIWVEDQFELILIENLALQFFRLARLYQTDANVAQQLFQNVRNEIENNDEVLAGLLKGESASATKFPGADLLIRYEANIWRQIDRIMERLQQWRRLRSELSTQPSRILEAGHDDAKE
jgi:hypothetical protein